MMERAFREVQIDTAIVSADTINDLSRNLARGEWLERLPYANVYILHGMDRTKIDQRVDDCKRTRGVMLAMKDAVCDPCTFVPNDDSPDILWWLDGTHSAAFSNLNNGPFGWDIRRETTTGARIGVLDSGVGYLDAFGVGQHPDLPTRDLGAYVVDATSEETANPKFYPAIDYLGHGTGVAGAAAAAGNNLLDTIGSAWWGTHIVPLRIGTFGAGHKASDFRRGLNWALGKGVADKLLLC